MQQYTTNLTMKTYILIFICSTLLTRDLILDVPGDLITSNEPKFGIKLINGMFHSLVLVIILYIADISNFIGGISVVSSKIKAVNPLNMVR